MMALVPNRTVATAPSRAPPAKPAQIVPNACALRQASGSRPGNTPAKNASAAERALPVVTTDA